MSAIKDGGPITVSRLSSGYYMVRGIGPCNWAQPPIWPCEEDTFRRYVFPEASEYFISAAMLAARGDA